MGGIHFRPAEIRRIYDMAREGHGPREIANVLGRRERDVHNHAKAAGIKFQPTVWTADEEEKLRQLLAQRCYSYQIACVLGRSEDAIKARVSKLRLKPPTGMTYTEWTTGIRQDPTYLCDGCDWRKRANEFRPEQLARSLQLKGNSRVCIRCEAEAAAPEPEPQVFAGPRDCWDEDRAIGGLR